MEYGSRTRFIVFALSGILLLILSIWGLTAIAKHVIRGSTKSTTSTQQKQIDLADYAKPSSFVRLTVQGPVVAEEKYRSYQIEVGQDYRDIKTFTGYNNSVTTEKRYTNNAQSYEVFLKSLRQSGFTSYSTRNYGPSEVGYCATGSRFVYELYDVGTSLQRTWGASCSAAMGTFTGTGPATRNLFRAQIPDFSTVTEGIGF